MTQLVQQSIIDLGYGFERRRAMLALFQVLAQFLHPINGQIAAAKAGELFLGWTYMTYGGATHGSRP
jgi:hypothetical protein